MKLPILHASLLVVLAGISASSSHAALVFSDTLSTTGPGGTINGDSWYYGPNAELANRQAGGQLVGISYAQRLDSGYAADIQTGRPAAWPNNGMYFEKAGQTSGNHRYVSPDLNLNTIPAPFTIAFAAVANSNTRTFWNGISILGDAASRNWEVWDSNANGGNNGNKLGMIWQADGQWQIFSNETLVAGGNIGTTIQSIAFDVGGGSFGGAAFTVGLKLNGNLVTTTSYSATDNYLSFGATFTNTVPDSFESASYRNLTVTTVPEPSCAILTLLTSGLLLIQRRR
jgi:hypothetical protein